MPFTLNEVVQHLTTLLKESKNVEAIKLLYADAIHTEEADPARTRSGKTTVLQSMQDFAEVHDFHYTHIEGPLVSGSHFALRLRFEATNHTT